MLINQCKLWLWVIGLFRQPATTLFSAAWLHWEKAEKFYMANESFYDLMDDAGLLLIFLEKISNKFINEDFPYFC